MSAAIALTLAACGAPAVDPAAVEAEVKAAIRTQVDAYAARNLDRMMSVMAPNYIWINHGQPNMTGEARVRAAISAQFADPALALSVAEEAVDVSSAGDMAVYRAIYRYTYTDPATRRPTTETGNWVAVFQRQGDGTMKLTRDVIVNLPAPTSQASAPAG